MRSLFCHSAAIGFSPMPDRVIDNNAFNEWYSPDGEARGSGSFRGEAGVMMETIEHLRGRAGNQCTSQEK